MAHIKRWQVADNKETELRLKPLPDLADNSLCLTLRRLIGLYVMIAHLLVDISKGNT